MKTIEVNIGLGNNPIQVEQIVNAFRIVFGRDVKWRLSNEGVWTGEAEDTLILKFDTDWELAMLQVFFKDLCGLQTQDAIAFLVDANDGHLSFNRRYDGERYEFDMKYFIRY